MFNLIANLASLAGVFISVWTLVVAHGARKAAREAAESVRRGNAAEDFSGLNSFATEFLGYIENDQVAAAAVRGRDLVSSISVARQRWRRFLSVESRARYEEASLQVGVIAQKLSASGPPKSNREKLKLLEICHNVVAVLGEESGKMLSRNEDGEARENG